MIYSINDYSNNNTFDADVCVIGSGAGGAVVAYELSSLGYSVIIVEEGGYYTTKDYDGKPLNNMKNMWRGAGSTVSFGIPPISIPTGKCVGGTTAINSATCFRTPEHIVEQWYKSLKLPLKYIELESYFERVEKIINVTELNWDVLGNCAKIVKRGADALGLHCKPLKHNVKNCKGCGTCQFGCVEGAKQSTEVSYIPMALQYTTTLLTRCRAKKIITKGNKAIGVLCDVVDNKGVKKATCKVYAKIIVCACGSMITPLLLINSGIKNKHLGKHLQIHPCSRVVALMDEEVKGWIGVSQGAYIDDFAHEGIMLEGIFVHPSILTASLPGVGKEFRDMAEQFSQIAAFGVMVHDTGEGAVFGNINMPLSWYSINKRDVNTLKNGIAYLSQEPSIFRKLTVEENLMAILETMKVTKQEMNKIIDSSLAEFGLTELRKQKAGSLSGGEKRRCEIARVLLTNPKFLLLDEPFVGIDPITISEIQNIMFDLKKKGMGILITDHNVRDTLEIIDRAYIIYQGKILLEGNSQELIDSPDARRVYLGEKFHV